MEAIAKVEVDATTTSVLVDGDDTTGLDVEDEEADAKTTTVVGLVEAVVEMDVEGGGVEAEGGGFPVTTTVFACKTVFVVYVVDVRRVVWPAASERSANVSGEEKMMTRALRRVFERRMARLYSFEGVEAETLERSMYALRRRRDAADGSLSDPSGAPEYATIASACPR